MLYRQPFMARFAEHVTRYNLDGDSRPGGCLKEAATVDHWT